MRKKHKVSALEVEDMAGDDRINEHVEDEEE